MKKSLLYFLVFFINSVVFSQEPPKMPKFIAKNAANIFYYDSNEVVEKVKIKKDEIENQTKKSLRIYNNKIKDISFLNSQSSLLKWAAIAIAVVSEPPRPRVVTSFVSLETPWAGL